MRRMIYYKYVRKTVSVAVGSNDCTGLLKFINTCDGFFFFLHSLRKQLRIKTKTIAKCTSCVT